MKNYEIGQGVKYKHRITELEILSYAELTGDNNPIHVNKNYAEKSPFGRQISHGMLIAGFVSYVLGMVFPGEGTIYMEQDIKFLFPVFVEDEIEINCFIEEMINLKKRIARLGTIIKNQDGIEVANGYAIVKLPE